MATISVVTSYVLLYIAHHLQHLNSIKDIAVFGAAPQYLGLFAIGCLGADVAFGRTPPLAFLRKPVFALMLLVISAITMVLVSKVRLWHGGVMAVPFSDFFVGIWAMSLMVAAANPEIAWLNKVFSWRPLVAIGTFAYSIYLIHGPLIQVIWQYVLFPLRPNPFLMLSSLCIIGIPLIVGCAHLFFVVCERPFLNTRKHETFAETERDAVLAPAP